MLLFSICSPYSTHTEMSATESSMTLTPSRLTQPTWAHTSSASQLAACRDTLREKWAFHRQLTWASDRVLHWRNAKNLCLKTHPSFKLNENLYYIQTSLFSSVCRTTFFNCQINGKPILNHKQTNSCDKGNQLDHWTVLQVWIVP